METRDFRIKLTKAPDDEGRFQGYAAIFDNVDDGGDVIKAGAFQEIETNAAGRVKVLAYHQLRVPIGTSHVEQDKRGLKFDAQLVVESTAGRDAHLLMKAGALDSMSIGFDVLEGGGKILNSGVRELTALKLWEISPVTFGMNRLARIEHVKRGLRDVRTIREFEDLLRDAGGFSGAEAKLLASGGWKALKVAPRDEADLAGALQQFAGRIDAMPNLKINL